MDEPKLPSWAGLAFVDQTSVELSTTVLQMAQMAFRPRHANTKASSSISNAAMRQSILKTNHQIFCMKGSPKTTFLDYVLTRLCSKCQFNKSVSWSSLDAHCS